MIPEFEPGGNLPPGVHECTWDEFVARFGTNTHRLRLIGGLKRALDALKRAGCLRVYVDGSFVTEKELPNDYDACWDTQGVAAPLLDLVFLIFDAGRQAQKTKYHGEFFPAHLTEGGSGRRFLDFFQTDRSTGDRKGIVVINLGGLP
jgi:hypothetical protein